MKIRRLHEVSKWDSTRYSLYNIRGNTLSLILINARERLEQEIQEKPHLQDVNNSLLRFIQELEDFLDDDNQVPGAEKELED